MPARRLIHPAYNHRAVFRFGVVGIVDLAIDTACVYGLRAALGLYGGDGSLRRGCDQYMGALNRLWTFRGLGSGPANRQWTKFMLTNLLGFVLNRGTYALLVTFVAAAATQPVIATAAGSIAGMFVNFTLSRRVVFTDCTKITG